MASRRTHQQTGLSMLATSKPRSEATDDVYMTLSKRGKGRDGQDKEESSTLPNNRQPRPGGRSQDETTKQRTDGQDAKNAEGDHTRARDVTLPRGQSNPPPPPVCTCDYRRPRTGAASTEARLAHTPLPRFSTPDLPQPARHLAAAPRLHPPAWPRPHGSKEGRENRAEQTHPKQAGYSQPGTQDPHGGGNQVSDGPPIDGVPTRLLPSSGTIAGSRTTGEVQTREEPPWIDRTRTPHGLPLSTDDGIYRPPMRGR